MDYDDNKKELVSLVSGESDNELNKDERIMVYREFKDLHWQIIRQVTLLRELNTAFELFKDRLKLEEILREQIVLGLLDMTISEFVAKILPIMEDIKTTKQSIVDSESILREQEIKFYQIHTSYKNIKLIVENKYKDHRGNGGLSNYGKEMWQCQPQEKRYHHD